MGHIGEKILKRRTELGLTQEELADRMGYKSKSSINKIELGLNDIPQSKVVKFSEVLDCSIAYLMDWEQIQKNNDIQTDIVVRMRTDEEFYEVVKRIYELDREKLISLRQLLQ
jgi:transcriptional regulator with XRE-family HTH domain